MATLSIKQLAVRGSAWTIIGFGASRIIRLSSNLVLTRLLVPEMFGVMALVNIFMVGLEMFSDVGIGPNIIQDDNGNDPNFQNTAWTIQVTRGFVLWICACVGAIPFASFYNEPLLQWLIPISGLTAIINGFKSTSYFTANRNLKLGRLTIIELASQLVTVSVMILWAYFNPSVWALVIGGIIGSTLKTLSTHVWLPGIKNKIYWDAKIARSLISFGRWIFLSTLLGFIIRYVDRIILGKFLTLSELGIYSIAVIFSGVVEAIYSRLSRQVLFPLYSKLKELPRYKLRARVKKVRMSLMMGLLPPLCILVVFGSDIIEVLFDPRYESAGWMLQVLAAGWVVPISTLVGPFYLAFGNSFLFMKLIAVRAFILLSSMVVGGLLAGTTGLICGVALADVIFYPFLVAVYRHHGLWIAYLDAIGIISSLVFIFLGLHLNGQLSSLLSLLGM
jgi:O-antigen/teichoic acid export membrane protein